MLKNSIETLGKTIRSLGQQLDRAGVQLEGKLSYTEHLNPSTRVVANQKRTPKFADNVFVAPNASVIGDVKIGRNTSIWYNAVVRGDVNHITVGDNTNIQDHAVVHVSSKDLPTKIGNNVTIGPSATIHACTIGDDCIIGSGAQVLDGAVVEPRSIITAGSLVSMNKRVPAGQLWSGKPARYLRELTKEEMTFMSQCSSEYAELAQLHAQECAKTHDQIEEEEERHWILENVGEAGLPQKDTDRKDQGMFFRY